MSADALHQGLDDNARLHALYRELEDLDPEGGRASAELEALRCRVEALRDRGARQDYQQALEDLHESLEQIGRAVTPAEVGSAGLCALLRRTDWELAQAALDWPQRRQCLLQAQLLKWLLRVPGQRRIPRLLHFIKTDADPTHLNPVNYLAIKSAIFTCPDYRIVLHAPERPHGPLWEELLCHLELNLQVPPQTLGAHRLKLAAHQADVWRVDALLSDGGIYLDWDLILLRSPEALRDHFCAMGVEPIVPGHNEVLGVSAIAAVPDAVFLRCWRNGMADAFRENNYVAHSTVLARELALAIPATVRILPSESFYFPGWSRQAMAWLFDPAYRLNEAELASQLAGSIGIHLFESHANFLSHAQGLTLERIQATDNNFRLIVQGILAAEL